MRALLLLILLYLPVSAHAEDRKAGDLIEPVMITRYSSLNSGVTREQQSLLDNIVSVSLKSNVDTVGLALHEVLAGSGFRLAELRNSDPYVDVLYMSPLPNIHKNLGPAKVRDLLIVLAGPAWQLITDPVNRLVTFDLKERYWPCGYSKGSVAQC